MTTTRFTVQVTPDDYISLRAVVDNAVAVVDLGGVPGPPGPGFNLVTHILPSEDQDGTTDIFSLPSESSSATGIQVFRNGLAEIYGLTYSSTTTHITFSTPPLPDDVIAVTYQVPQ